RCAWAETTAVPPRRTSSIVASSMSRYPERRETYHDDRDPGVLQHVGDAVAEERAVAEQTGVRAQDQQVVLSRVGHLHDRLLHLGGVLHACLDLDPATLLQRSSSGHQGPTGPETSLDRVRRQEVAVPLGTVHH